MNSLAAEARSLAEGVCAAVQASSTSVDVGVCPPAIYLSEVQAIAKDSAVQVGAQNCHQASNGAFTGEVSAPMLESLGIDFVILGHSERRQLFGDTDQSVRAKLDALLETGLGAIVCVGEPLEDRDAGRHEEVVGAQVKAAIEGLSPESMARISLAYEPIWAIGTGRTASPEQAAAMHAVIRGIVAASHGATIAAALRILYGGSVKPANAETLLASEGVDGALVGGASLKTEAFAAIVKAAEACAR